MFKHVETSSTEPVELATPEWILPTARTPSVADLTEASAPHERVKRTDCREWACVGCRWGGFVDPVRPVIAETHHADDRGKRKRRHGVRISGLGDAESARLDIQWRELGMYSFHYVDSNDVNWRFDRHPNTHSPEIHFHPPSDAATTATEPSCTDVTEVSLVTRAVHAMWRAAYENDDMGQLNSASNPP
ncbi:hypothetical protein JCM31271_26480 [Halorubrum trueperi]